jgi:hypothetical protein
MLACADNDLNQRIIFHEAWHEQYTVKRSSHLILNSLSSIYQHSDLANP